MITSLFRTRYRIYSLDDDWMVVSVKWSIFPWERIGVSRNMEQAMQIIKAHKSHVKPVKVKPKTVYEE